MTEAWFDQLPGRKEAQEIRRQPDTTRHRQVHFVHPPHQLMFNVGSETLHNAGLAPTVSYIERLGG